MQVCFILGWTRKLSKSSPAIKILLAGRLKGQRYIEKSDNKRGLGFKLNFRKNIKLKDQSELLFLGDK